ncbi:hypothetical protein [Hungatella hathewayi]|uniref:hypothetical protein n=1 Tax=Hungatella hathewayi TaxID=154046 RepID=UPI00356715A0
MRKLTENEINKLQKLKGTRGGADRFFDMIEEIYMNDTETLADIHKCREMKDSLDWIESWPAYEKTKNMYYEYMDELLAKIGYHKK